MLRLPALGGSQTDLASQETRGQRNARIRIEGLKKPDPDNDISLLPRNWNSLSGYIALFQPENTTEIANFEAHVTMIERHIVKFLAIPHSSDSSPLLRGTLLAQIFSELDNVAEMADRLARMIADGK